ncbi:hypothetical protein FOT49_10070 [Citrobacter freundii]|nr:hypothetical protein [Citrobacter freundii]MBE0056116.1 hypothetical protein [Citrobacter freundii]
MCDERVRLHGLDLSTKHVVSDTREPEMKKPRRIARLNICGRLDRRYDRGTGAMHLANTPVVSPESKTPRWRGSRYIQIVRFSSLPSWRSSAKHEWII